MGLLLDSTVLITAERAGKNPRKVIEDITAAVGDLLIGATALELGYGVATHNVRHFRLIPSLVVRAL